MGEAEEEYQHTREKSPEVEEGDYEGESCCSEEDVAYKERAKLRNQVTRVAKLWDAVGMVGSGNDRGNVHVAKGLEN